MKDSAITIIMMLSWIVIYLIVDDYSLCKRLDTIEQKIDDTHYQDSIYWDHIGHCAFIDSDDIEIDKYGRVYSSYVKNPTKTK